MKNVLVRMRRPAPHSYLSDHRYPFFFLAITILQQQLSPCDDQIIVFLTLLGKDILAADEIIALDNAVGVL